MALGSFDLVQLCSIIIIILTKYVHWLGNGLL